MVGKATDRSGFGGASFSSETLDEDDAEQNKGAVQVPDPFLKNVMMRASYAVFAALRAHFSESEIVELTANIAGYNMVSRFMEALELLPDERAVATRE